MGQRVLITHISWFLSRRLARRLEDDPDVEYVLGVDLEEPGGDLERTEFLKADVRRPVMLRVLEATGIDTVVHLGLYSTPSEAGGRSAMHDLNVIGAMQVMAACQRAESVKRVIVRSSTAVYGAEHNDPAIFTEEMERGSPRDPFARDTAEMEAYVRELARRREDIDLTTFRFANILGPTADTPLAHYLTMPVVPTVLGYDPRLQFIHEDDAVELLVRAIKHPVRGTFNAVADGVMYLSQVIRSGGRFELPLPTTILNLSGPAFQILGRRLEVPPHILRMVQWGRVADNRKLREEYGFSPSYSTRDAVREFYTEHRLRRLAPPAADRWERELHEFLTKRDDHTAVAGGVGNQPESPST